MGDSPSCLEGLKTAYIYIQGEGSGAWGFREPKGSMEGHAINYDSAACKSK